MGILGEAVDKLFCSVQMNQLTVGMMERFRKYDEVLEPGWPCAMG
jgi:hypothetical protein